MAKKKSTNKKTPAKTSKPHSKPHSKPLGITEKRDDIILTYKGEKAHTPEELLEQSDIDLAVWEVASIVVNQWEVGGKISRGQGKRTGRWLGEELWQMPLKQVTVKLRRRAPKPVQEAISLLLKDNKWPTLPGKVPGKKAAGRVRAAKHFMLEMALHDAHFGKLAWAMETGQDYDLKIAERVYCQAIDDLLLKVQHLAFESVIFPIGSDFFHVDNWIGTTSNGTPVESTDDRFSKIFQVGVRAISYAIDRCREIAPVQAPWVPGNHDQATSWFLTQVLKERFRDTNVTVDDSLRGRKYIHYGQTMLGLVHGDDIRKPDLPLIMAGEAPDIWAATKYRLIHTGHLHKKAETRHLAGDTYNGVEVWVLQSLCGCDSWHFRKGYVNNVRAAEAYVFERETGPYGHFSSMLLT